MSTPSNLVTAEELSPRLRGDDPPLVLDVRWSLSTTSTRGSDEAGYRAGHLPGAVFVDLDEELAGPPGPGGRHPLPSAEVVGALFARLGLERGREVVVYDAGHGMAAARAWWCLRYFGCPAGSVRVLAGGLEGWVDAGLKLERGVVEPVPAKNPLPVTSGGMPVVNPILDGYLNGLAAGNPPYRLVDARAPERYRGEVEPIDRVAGHIPGAGNLPFTAVTREGRLVAPDLVRAEVALALAQVGAQGDRVAVYCGSGITAAVLALALEEAGIEAPLYPGSFSEWIADPGRPVDVLTLRAPFW